MSLELYNTLSGKKDLFNPPLSHIVTIYNCGPTVYNYAHVGNLRAYVFADVLRRTLEYRGYAVKQVINITDVGHLTSDADDGDDKMVRALKRLGRPMTLEAMREVADIYTAAFRKDLQALNILPPHEMPRASDHIQEDIELVRTLEEKGFAYSTQDGLYFDTSKFPAYGKLGSINLKGQQAGARIDVKNDKKNPRDFVLWKLSTNELGWESPWGKGFPGWHIECSAMSRKYLGQPFDIHTGGIDHIPVHHNNEIAQSEAAYDVPLAHIWMHNEFVNMGEAKMAKSGEDFTTLQTLKDKGIHPLVYRYYLLQASYRSPMRFSLEALQSAKIGYWGLMTELAKKRSTNESEVSAQEETILRKIRDSVSDDLNTAYPIGLLWSSVSTFQKASPRFLKKLDLLLGLDIEKQTSELVKNTIPDNVKKFIREREDARNTKDFKRSDDLRDQIQKEGFEVMDTDSGSIVRKKL